MCEPGILKVAETKPDSETKIENAVEVVSLFLIHTNKELKYIDLCSNIFSPIYFTIFTTSITQYLPDSHFYIQVLFEPLHRLI